MLGKEKIKSIIPQREPFLMIDEIEEYIKKNGMPGMVRVSLGAYNSEKEVNIFLETIEYICKKCL